MKPIVRLAVLSAALLACGSAHSAEPSPNAIELPAVFQHTFLDLRSDVREAASQGKRLMLYFGQDGCPYCKLLLQDNLRQKDIAEQVEKHLYPIAFNMWGDREVTWLDGTVSSEKALAARLHVQFTPTLLFLDESAHVVARVNGYYPPHRFRAAIDYVIARMESQVPFSEYMRSAVREPASGKLNAQPVFASPPLNLVRSGSGKALALFVEQTSCRGCDEMHAGPLRSPVTQSLLRQLDVARIDLFGSAALVGPKGERSSEAGLGKALKIAYTPSLLLFDSSGREVLRVEGYVRAFHLQSALDYAASGAYRTQPSFQRYLQQRSDRLRQQGVDVRLW